MSVAKCGQRAQCPKAESPPRMSDLANWYVGSQSGRRAEMGRTPTAGYWRKVGWSTSYDGRPPWTNQFMLRRGRAFAVFSFCGMVSYHI